MPVVLHPDPMNAVMLNSVALVVSPEQRNYVQEILEIACADSKFVDKAYRAIERVLTAGPAIPPVVSSLVPPSAVIGSANFTLRVLGTGFKNTSKIVFNGGEEVTTYISATELRTGVNMSTVSGPVVVPVAVLNADGVQSDPKSFSFTV